MMRYEVTWRHAFYGKLLFECETDEQAGQLLRLLRGVRHFAIEPDQAPVEEVIKDLVSKGFVDVTPPGEKCPGYDEEYVFRGPDGVLYSCWSQSAVFNVFATYEHFGRNVSIGNQGCRCTVVPLGR